MYEWHDEILKEKASTIIESLGEEGARLFKVTKTEKGIRFVECCDGYYGTTLSVQQLKRFIKELEALCES